MQPVAEAVTISMRLGYTLAPLAAMPPCHPPNSQTHHCFPSSLGDPLDTSLLPASLSENLQSVVSKRPLDPNGKYVPSFLPSLGILCLGKNIWFILHFRSSGTFLVFTKMYNFAHTPARSHWSPMSHYSPKLPRTMTIYVPL